MTDQNKMRILVIDDEEGIRNLIKVRLEKTSEHAIDTASSAAEGFEKIAGESYDIIFLDVLMPKMEGHEALARIKQHTQTPVIIMSSYLSQAQEQNVLRAGAFGCMKKPFKWEEIDGWLQKVKPQQN